MVKIWIDAGHGGADAGAVGSPNHVEKVGNLHLSLLLNEYLLHNFSNVQTALTRTNDRTVSLSERTNAANRWGADYFISIHHNAATPAARGYEDFIHKNSADTSVTGRVRGAIHTEVRKRILGKYGLPNRGAKKADFHVLRATNMPASLIEVCFVSNGQDRALMDNPQFYRDFTVALGEGLAVGLGLSRKSAPTPAPTAPAPAPAPEGTLYRVSVGAYRDIENARAMEQRLRSAGFSAYISKV